MEGPSDSSDKNAALRTRRLARRALLRIVALAPAAVATYFSIELATGSLTKNESAPWISLGGLVFLLTLFLAEWPLFSEWLDHKLGPEDGVAWPEEEPIDRVLGLGNALPIPGQLLVRVFLFTEGFGFRGGGKWRRAYVPFADIVGFNRTPTFQISLFATRWSTIAYERNGRRRSLGITNGTFDSLQRAYDAWKQRR